MRDYRGCFFGAVLLALFGMAACGTTPAITVVRSKGTEPAEQLKGDTVKIKRGTQEGYVGARGGFYVVRNADDWNHAWPEERGPALPSGIDRSHMLVFTVAESKKVSSLHVERMLETAEMVYVWVKETRFGENCANRSTERAFDAVTSPRVDKPVKFFVDEERGESCGPAPEAKVECRLKDQPNWSASVAAQPSDTIECELTSQAKGRFEVVDRVMSIELPPGSSSKLSFPKGPTRAALVPDVFGTYVIKGEAADENGRRGKAAATVDVKPPKTKDVLVQMVWTGFDITDEPDTFPRVNLRVDDEGPKGQRCSGEIAVPGLCDVKTRGPYTYMHIPAGSRKLVVSAQYLDERAEKGPGPCIHVWFDGARTAETCDRRHRSAEEIWKIGNLDTATGKLTVDPSTGSSLPASVSTGDAGAPPPTKP
jgi:hypothetical protein